MTIRVGLGYDVHPFVADGERDTARSCSPACRSRAAASLGHSDADAVAHAVADALLGPAGLPDLGTLFPASDEQYRDASSLELLRDVCARVAESGWQVVNVDIVITAEEPRLAPHLDAMARNLVDILGPTRSCRSSRSAARASARSDARRGSRCGRSRSWSVRSDHGGLPRAGRLHGRAPSSHGGAARTAAAGSPHSWDHRFATGSS